MFVAQCTPLKFPFEVSSYRMREWNRTYVYDMLLLDLMASLRIGR